MRGGWMTRPILSFTIAVKKLSKTEFLTRNDVVYERIAADRRTHAQSNSWKAEETCARC